MIINHIPLNRPSLLGLEFVYMGSVADGQAEPGYFTKACEDLLESYFDGARVLLTSSGTSALELAAMLLPERRGTHAVMPTFTFSSTANAFMRSGIKPRFVDIRADTFNMDEREASWIVDHNTAAIVPVHYGGVACEIFSILRTGHRWGIPVVEDNAHGIFGEVDHAKLGTIGSMAALSFHETKNFQCGEGGALVIKEADVGLAERIRDKGTNRAALIRGEVDKYTWTDVGSSFVLAEMSAAYLFAQLENREHVRLARRAAYNTYFLGLRDWCRETGSRMQHIPDDCTSTHHLFPLVLPSEEARNRLVDHLKLQGIGAAFHYVPLHLSPMGERLGYRNGQFPVAEEVASRLVRLPIYPGLTSQQQAFVIECVRESGV